MTRLIRFIAAAALLLSLSLELKAQEEIIHTVNNVREEYSVLATSDYSTSEIRKTLQNKCTEKAIAQVTSAVYNTWSSLYTVNSDSGSESESYNSLASISVTERGAEIVGMPEFGQLEQIHGDGIITFYLTGNFKIKVGKTPDPEFIVPVKGLKTIYMTGDNLHFSFAPTKDCYMRLFLLENKKTGYMLMPNDYSPDDLRLAGDKYIFDNNYRSYIEFTKSPDLDIEFNKLIFVFTTRKWAVDRDCMSTNKILEWIAKIPNDEKYIYQAIIEIREN